MAARCSNNRYTNSYKGPYKPTSFFPHSCMYFDKRAFDSLSNFFRVIGIEIVLFLNSFPENLPSQRGSLMTSMTVKHGEEAFTIMLRSDCDCCIVLHRFSGALASFDRNTEMYCSTVRIDIV